MTPLLFAAVAVAGGVGAGLRYVLDLALTRALGNGLPWGILVVNLTGAFALGMLAAGMADATGLWVLGSGLLGGYTTFSSVAVSTVLLARDRRPRASVAYAAVTFLGTVVLALAGLGVGALLV
ncbi:fluoride efflux transporter FluC [Microbacterium sp. RD1]|uniref:fluoride efflux transporter FluC n=1 Tax=Microbacterium sp. RD1 TaxID=3457313 RepID=UPI003FA596E5